MNSRYVIYELLNKRVKTKLVKYFGGHNINGKCTKVYRDVMANIIELTVNGRSYQFKEPNVIAYQKGRLCFMYGVEEEDLSDDQLFDEMRLKAASGMNIDDILKDNVRGRIKVIKFEVIDM